LDESPRWNPATRIGFRFTFSYLVLYIFPFPLDVIPGAVADFVFSRYQEIWQELVLAVGRRFFGVTATVVANGSGDTTFDYLKMLCMAGVAVLATIVWSILDRRRPSYTRLNEWLRVYVRFSLAAAMISYGAAKVIPPRQFPPPTLDRLLQPFGDASPMGLLWTFMGASVAYTFFSGAGELLSGLLLTFRRTTLLGALIGMAVLVNIVALNFFYDVPVKLYSSHLLAMAVFLMLPDARRLVQFFVLHPPGQLIRGKALHIASLVLRSAVALFIVYSAFQSARQVNLPRSPLRGIWNVDVLTVDGVDRPPLITDEARWRFVVFDYAQVVAFQTIGGSRTRYQLKLDEQKGTMRLKRRDDPRWSATLTYQRPDPSSLVVDGAMDGRTYHAILRKAPIPTFRLTTRGFHWINETPFNR
jgi:hypothetical protein